MLGNWALTKRTLAQLPSDLQRSYRAGQEKFANKVLKKVKDHINYQDLGHTPLSRGTIRKKGGNHILIDTRTYVESIQKYTQRSSVQVGVKRGIINPESGEEVAKYAALNEYGSPGGRIPPRPVWGPSLAELGGKEAIAKEVRALILASAIKRGYDVSKIAKKLR